MNLVKQAAKLAAKSDHKQHHHAAILVRAGSVVGVGYNHHWRHAEVVAMGKVWPNKRGGLCLWSFRFLKSGEMGMAKPCPECQKALRESGITDVHYSTRSGIERMRL